MQVRPQHLRKTTATLHQAVQVLAKPQASMLLVSAKHVPCQSVLGYISLSRA